MNKKPVPFADMSAQTSLLLLEFADAVKAPLVELYNVAAEEHLSQHKHIVWVAQAVLQVSPGQRIKFDFDEEKISKTVKLQEDQTISEWAQKVVIIELNRVRSIINKFEARFKMQKEEKIFHVFKSLIVDFNAGDNLDFHKMKALIVDTYNKSVGVPAEQLYHLKPLTVIGIPVVVQN